MASTTMSIIADVVITFTNGAKAYIPAAQIRALTLTGFFEPGMVQLDLSLVAEWAIWSNATTSEIAAPSAQIAPPH